ncbi:MAG: D-isomer specific 2-hydroxyacid dehydrogenase NAD-binding protein [Gammaproteobacteria bacterium]|nr:D-isomer specific 2-hydroxyacid dehydrogenase NAD-binding protein [Gammaproteobacteria bacterium]
MKVAIFSTKDFEKPFLTAANQSCQHELVFFEALLNEQTAVLAAGFPAVSCFVTDNLSAPVLTILAKNGTSLIALRSAGFNHVDLAAAKNLSLTVARVPAYSPYSVAEFAVGLILTLNRKIHRAYHLVREHNFLLTHLLGFDLHGKTVGIIGTGKIGSVFAKIMQGFGCNVVAFDPFPNDECLKRGVQYMTLNALCQQSDIISLHCPLNDTSHHMINEQTIRLMKPGVMVINTGRGALIDTKAIIQALKNKKIGYLGMDVYEEEHLFFQDLSETIIQDDVFARLQTFPNVIITGHQAFFTQEALTNIAAVTLGNITAFEHGNAEIFTIPL